MPTYRVTDPSSGRTLKLTGDSPPTEQELNEIFGSQQETENDVVNPTEEPVSSGEDKKITLGVGAAAVGAGAAGYTAVRAFNRPQRQIKIKEKSLDQIKSEYLNEPFIASRDLPSRIQGKSAIEQQEMKVGLSSEKSKLQSLKTEQANLSRKIGDDLKNFDNQVLNKTVEEFGSSIKETFPKIVNQTYKNYGNKLDEFTATLEKSGKTLQANSFIKEVVDNTIRDSVASGVPQEKLGKLLSFRDTFASSYTNEPLTISHLKGNVDSLGVDLPQGASIKLRDNWGKFLSNNATEIDSDFHTIQRDYSKFANMRDSIYDEMQGGEFDKTKINKLLFDYAKTKAETGLSETIKLMADGNNIVTGVPEIRPKFEKLQGVISARKNIESLGKSVVGAKSEEINSAMSRIRDIDTRIQESKLSAMKWASKADQLLSEQSQIITKHPIRSGGVGRMIQNITGVAQRAATASGARAVIGRAVPPLQVMASLLQAGEFISDPAVGWGKQVGVDVPAKGTKERFVLEELINNKPIPAELNISEDEKFNILYDYGLAL